MKAGIPWLIASVGAFAAGSLSPSVAPPTDGRVNFNRDVKPILSEKCFKCHGPDAETVAAGLRLDLAEEATKDRKGKRAIVPGDPGASLVMQKVAHLDPNYLMPPPNSGVPPLTEAEKETLERWIEQGAVYEKHWSFVPAKRPALPKVSDPSWVRNPIDAFVLAELDQAGLKPEAEADPYTLITRASLALTGLPPTPEEIARFVEDRSPRAYERLVDRLLASPHYGEHQARYWLDAVRYGDTHGLHLDNERSIYPYRDWVVRAFNEDLRFDEFTIWQLAGDMLPKPKVDQLVATGYIRMNPTTNEGGAIEEEFLAKNTFDRVDTTSTIFLGLTVACARCHDHKYDPISQKDYYRLYAFFNSTEDRPLDGNLLLPEPVMRVTGKADEAKIAIWDRHRDRAIATVAEREALAWLSEAWKPLVVATAWEVAGPFEAANFEEAFVKAFSAESESETTTWRPLDFKPGRDAVGVVGKENAAAYVRATLTVPVEREVEAAFSSDDAIKIWLNGAAVHDNKVLRGLNQSVDRIKLPLRAGENRLLVKVVNAGGPDGLAIRFGSEFAERIDAMHEIWTNHKKSGRRDPRELARLYLEAGPENKAALAYRAASKAKTEHLTKLPQTLIAKELPKPREAFVLRRGEYDLPSEKVDRGLPEALGRLDPKDPVDRMGLARWLVARDNPLVARVFVNRIWQQHFGTGIVKTAEDFGSQGEWPSHPELLDYLAVEFREKGWSVKKLHRSIVTSAAFRQRSSMSPEKLAKDAENRLISRGPRYRLDAEVIRDRALAASGLLAPELGGKGFKPYQPEGLWEAIAFLESTTARYAKDPAPDIYRRSLYMFWKRTSPHPVMLSFDAPMRESCSVRRSRTNTPLQALVLLNEPAFLEASRALAQRVLLERKTDDERLERAAMLTVGRIPSALERDVLMASLARNRATFKSEPERAAKLLAVGDAKRDESLDPSEHAAWMIVCSTLMNTDEFVTMR